MKKRIMLSLTVLLAVLLFGTGCAESSYLQQKEDADEMEQEPEDDAAEGSDDASDQIYVQVSGAVEKPGVYGIQEGSRVYQIIEKAGGLRNDASVKDLNQARRLSDEEHVHVPTVEEAQQQISDAGTDVAGKVNLNTATAEELMTLSGIGESKAQEIIRYRQEQGGFSSIEELQNVSGIGENTYKKLADGITVN